MHRYYGDILDRIDGKPLWFDEHGVPRYRPFKPELLNIYASEAVLALIECQACGTEFKVAFAGFTQKSESGRQDGLAMEIEGKTLHYGDPPNTQCCDAGPSMNSIPVHVLEYWVKPHILGEGKGINKHGRETIIDTRALRFRRNPELEVELRPDWAGKR